MTTTNKPTLIAVADGASPLDVLAARHRVAWDRTQRGRQEWIEGTLELAAVLAEERRLLPDNQDFSRWLERNGLAKISAHDRIALIGMAKDLVVTREVLESTSNTSWEYIWKNGLKERVGSSPKTHQTPEKRKSKTERQLIEKVLNLNGRGFTYDETAAELGLTKGQVAGIVFRNGNTKNKPPAPPPPPREYKGLDSKTLTREQVDPDFKGDAVQFATKYGHVLLHTKSEIEENKRQEILRIWLAAVTSHQQTGRALAIAEAPDPETLRQWLAKPGKAERLRAWLTTVETAYRNIALGLELLNENDKPL
jgi:hypothetical protein